MPQYSMVIRWSEVDEVFMVRLPEFENALTHGDTYAEAAKNGQELIESFMMWYGQDGKPLPKPFLFDMDKGRLENPRDVQHLTIAD
jgi:predicted RNase H-like HicB family nuclease